MQTLHTSSKGWSQTPYPGGVRSWSRHITRVAGVPISRARNLPLGTIPLMSAEDSYVAMEREFLFTQQRLPCYLQFHPCPFYRSSEASSGSFCRSSAVRLVCVNCTGSLGNGSRQRCYDRGVMRQAAATLSPFKHYFSSREGYKHGHSSQRYTAY